MDLLAQILVNGILLGGLYAVMALGLASGLGRAQHRQSRARRLHHAGRLCVLVSLHLRAASIRFWDCRLPPPSCSAFGYALQRGLLNLIVRAPMFNTLLITFGLEVVLTYLAQLAFSADFRTINPAYAGNSIGVGTGRAAGRAACRLSASPSC